MWCWGDSYYGQVGSGLPARISVPVTVPGVTGAAQLAGGQDFTCAALVDGTVKCWGYDVYGQLGSGVITPTSAPVTVSGITTPSTSLQVHGTRARCSSRGR